MKFNPAEWEEKRLSEIAICDPEEDIPQGTKVKQVNLDKLRPNQKFISGFDEVVFTGKGKKFRNYDVLLPQISSALSNGKTAFVTFLEDGEIGVGSNWYLVLRAIPEKTDPNYLYYLSISPRLRALALQSLTGSSRNQYVNVNDLMKHCFPVPSLQEQRKIAKTLSTIDNKIQKNCLASRKIEEILKKTYYNWFVAFNFSDECRTAYQDNRANSYQNDLGICPNGWKIGCLCDLGDIIAGATPSKKIDSYYAKDGNGIPWITPKDLSLQGTKFISRGAVDITQEGLDHCGATILPRGTVLFSSRAPIGYIAIASNELTTNQGFRSIVPHEEVGSTFIYFLLMHKMKEIMSLASGTTFQEISGSTLKKLRVIIPPSCVLRRFNEKTYIFLKYQENLEKENLFLASMRDVLLPMLISGAISIPTEDR